MIRVLQTSAIVAGMLLASIDFASAFHNSFHESNDIVVPNVEAIQTLSFSDCVDLRHLPRALLKKEVARRKLPCWNSRYFGKSTCHEDDYGNCGVAGDILKIDDEGFARWTLQGSYMPEN